MDSLRFFLELTVDSDNSQFSTHNSQLYEHENRNIGAHGQGNGAFTAPS